MSSKTTKKDQEPTTWPRLKSVKESSYEQFLSDAINADTGKFYPQKDEDNRSIKGTGALYLYTDIYRLRRSDGSEYLYSKGTHSLLYTILLQFTSLRDLNLINLAIMIKSLYEL